MSKILIRGGCVLTMGRANHAEADVLIDGQTVAAVGSGLRARDAEVIDASGAIVMPGFVDAHRHTGESLLRNIGETSISGADLAGEYDPDDLFAATLVGLLGALDAGITTVVDWCDAIGGPEHLDAAVRAHTEAGTRSVLVVAADGTADRDPQEQLRRAAGIPVSPLLTGAAGLRYPSGAGSDATAWGAARSMGLRVHTHAGSEGDRGTAAALAAQGVLGPDVTLVHCSHFDGADLDAVSSSGTRIVLTPAAEMAMGVGSPPIQELIDRGLRPGLGSETERMSPGDIFAQVRAVISLQHATVFDRKLAGKAGLPKLLTTREVIRYGTVDGAVAAGLDDTTGVIEEGRQADLVVLRADRPNIHPVNDPIGAVVWGMDTSNVDWVLVAGEIRKRAGRLVADVDRARSLAVAARERIGGSGLFSGTGRAAR